MLDLRDLENSQRTQNVMRDRTREADAVNTPVIAQEILDRNLSRRALQKHRRFDQEMALLVIVMIKWRACLGASPD